MTSQQLRRLFIQFFVSKGHKEIPSASLVPENDPTVLFTTAGMHPLVPYLMGQPHPLGKRLCSVQKCLRTDDIEEVGDLRHFTFFEMIGNWSLGDYFKKEAIQWSFEFLTDKRWLGLDPKKIYITVFAGDQNAPKDEESVGYWQDVFKKVGIQAKVGERIFCYGKKENWWGPAGQTGPCGPDTEMFYDTGLTHSKKFGESCHPNCDCGRFVEIWNDVFMEFNKKNNGKYEPLKQKNVDTGMGLERMVSILEFIEGRIKSPDPFLTNLFWPLIEELEKLAKKQYKDYKKEFRIIVDHLRASVFLIADGVEPSNKDRGYVLRKLIRRMIIKISELKEVELNYLFKNYILENFVEKIINIYSSRYKDLNKNNNLVKNIIKEEWMKFYSNMKSGYPALMKVLKKPGETVSAIDTFHLFDTHGVHPSVTLETAKKFNKKVDIEGFKEVFKKHQDVSRVGANQKFSGGLQDHSDITTRLHTATHLLHAALRKVLGGHVQQVGSHITAERLRFDFTHPEKLTDKQIKKIQEVISEQIKRNQPVKMEIMILEEAEKSGALAFFGQKYPDKVKVYTIEGFSKEVCGGPHTDFTGKLGHFKIIKEEAVGAGKRRIYGTLK